MPATFVGVTTSLYSSMPTKISTTPRKALCTIAAVLTVQPARYA